MISSQQSNNNNEFSISDLEFIRFALAKDLVQTQAQCKGKDTPFESHIAAELEILISKVSAKIDKQLAEREKEFF